MFIGPRPRYRSLPVSAEGRVAVHSVVKKRVPSVRISEGNGSAGGSRLYRLDVLPARKGEDPGDERPQRLAS